jgi:hypothetical protein
MGAKVIIFHLSVSCYRDLVGISLSDTGIKLPVEEQQSEKLSLSLQHQTN